MQQNERWQGQLSGAITSSHSVQVSYTDNTTDQLRRALEQPGDRRARADRPQLPQRRLVGRLQRRAHQQPVRRGRATRRRSSASATPAARAPDHRLALPQPGRAARRPAPTATTTRPTSTPPIPRTATTSRATRALSWFLTSESLGSHDLKVGAERFVGIGRGGNSQTATDYVLLHRLPDPERPAGGGRQRPHHPGVHARPLGHGQLAGDARRPVRHHHRLVLPQRPLGDRRQLVGQPRGALRGDQHRDHRQSDHHRQRRHRAPARRLLRHQGRRQVQGRRHLRRVRRPLQPGAGGGQHLGRHAVAALRLLRRTGRSGHRLRARLRSVELRLLLRRGAHRERLRRRQPQDAVDPRDLAVGRHRAAQGRLPQGDLHRPRRLELHRGLHRHHAPASPRSSSTASRRACSRTRSSATPTTTSASTRRCCSRAATG